MLKWRYAFSFDRVISGVNESFNLFLSLRLSETHYWVNRWLIIIDKILKWPFSLIWLLKDDIKTVSNKRDIFDEIREQRKIIMSFILKFRFKQSNGTSEGMGSNGK